MLSIQLPEDIEKRLAALAKKTGRTKAFHAREAILYYLEDMEDYYLAAEAYADFANSDDRALSAREAGARFGGASR